MKSLIIEALSVIAILAGCSVKEGPGTKRVEIPVIICSTEMKSSATDENRITDINITVIGENSIAEQHIYRSIARSDAQITLSLLEGRSYDIYAFANAGYDMGAMNREELEALRWYLRYPDSFEHGIPASCHVEKFIAEEGSALKMEMTRLLSRISVRLDRSALDKDVSFFPREARIGNCARSAAVFSRSGARNKDDLFASGYYTSAADSFFLYTLENCQGQKDENLCSYVEMEIDYDSPTLYSEGGKGLVYRFYIRENDSFDVERNCHYNITVRPRNDGLLTEDSWRVDKSSLVEHSLEPYLKINPSGTTVDGKFYANYYQMQRLDSMHLALSYYPSSMKISLDEEMVQEEKEDGRALYTMDSDGHGFTVRSLGRICQSSMNILVESPYKDLEEMIVIDVSDRESSQ